MTERPGGKRESPRRGRPRKVAVDDILDAAIELFGSRGLKGTSIASVAVEMGRLALYPAGAVLFFLGLSFASTGQWFVTGGFYVPDPELQGQPYAVYEAIRDGLEDLAGARFTRWTGYAIAIMAMAALLRRRWSGLAIPLALVAAAAAHAHDVHELRRRQRGHAIVAVTQRELEALLQLGLGLRVLAEPRRDARREQERQSCRGQRVIHVHLPVWMLALIVREAAAMRVVL